jgi:predicted dehydrogenase
MSDPRLCIVGAGRHATRRIYPYIGAVGAQLVGVCDLDREKAERNARRFGGRVYQEMEAMLTAEHPDGVILCMDPQQHADLAPVAMRRGIPVYTEKPPAATAAAALAVARVSRETGVLCTTAFKKRYNVAYTRAREWIQGFPPEDLYSLSIDFASSGYRDDGTWNTFLLDFAIHVIDLVGYLFGDTRQVFAFAKGKNAYAVSLQFENGAVGSLCLTDGRSFGVPTEEVEITVRGGNFMTIHNSSCWRITEKEKPCEWREPPTFVSGGDSGNETGHLAEIVDFVAALGEGRTTGSGPSAQSRIEESYKSMVLYEAIRDSAARGEVVPVRYELP